MKATIFFLIITLFTTLHAQQPILLSRTEDTVAKNTKAISEICNDDFYPAEPEYFKMECYSDPGNNTSKTESINPIRRKEATYINIKSGITSK